jgi:hypothetical protein
MAGQVTDVAVRPLGPARPGLPVTALSVEVHVHILKRRDTEQTAGCRIFNQENYISFVLFIYLLSINLFLN